MNIDSYLAELFMNFLFDFLANFFSDLVLGVALGTFLAWWVGKKLNDLARTQQHKDEKRAELEKAIRYLELLKGEIGCLLSQLPDQIRRFRKSSLDHLVEIGMPTSTWDILRPSGELPRLPGDPRLLASLAQFYDQIMYVKRASHLVMDGFFASHLYLGDEEMQDQEIKEMLNQEILNDMTLSGLEKAHQTGRDLPDRLGSEIQRLKQQLETLSK